MRQNVLMENEKILIVDDNRENRELLSVLMERSGWQYDTAESGRSALDKMAKTGFEIVITDLMMPQMNGIELLEKIKENHPGTEVIIVTAYGSIPTAVAAMRKGAWSYLLRPFDPEEVALAVKKIFELLSIRSENVQLREELVEARGPGRIVGKGSAMAEIFGMIDTVAKTNATVMVLGESGTGKEMIARAIHMKSQRKDHPFIKVSCAALAESLLETELFGHEKGAFTGAVALRKGRFELADKGTLFLDEIGEISQTVQVKLLRVIQEREFERIGGTETISTDTRIISATNRDLAKEVREGRFREDLFYRLNVIQIESPPLRSRREDIPLLAYHFLEKYKTETSKDITSISDSALSYLSAYEWPGNVRELQNVIERGVVLTKNKTLELADLPDQIRKNGEGQYHVPEDDDLNHAIVPLKQAKTAWEKRYIENGLKRFDGNVSRTAIAIGIARKNLQEKIKTYGISTADFKNP